MILTLLKDAERQGKRGLEPREMLIQITKRWRALLDEVEGLRGAPQERPIYREMAGTETSK